MSCGRLPDEDPLASQPTLSRFENAVTAREIKQAGVALAQQVLKQVPQDLGVVTLEVEAANDSSHGQQRLQLFSGYYREHWYVPLLGHLVEPDGRRRLLFALLRPGNASSLRGLPGVVRKKLVTVAARLVDADFMSKRGETLRVS